MNLVLGVALFVSGGIALLLGRRALALVDRLFQRRIERWLREADAADGRYVHLARTSPPAPAPADPARPAPPVGFDSLAAAR